jgi:hypothetical protein
VAPLPEGRAGGADGAAAGVGVGPEDGADGVDGREPGRLRPPEPPAMDSRSLRATGASTVEDGDFTYSPRS